MLYRAETGKNKYEVIFRAEVKAMEWAFDRIKEAFEQVAQDEARKLSTVQEIMIRSTDYLRRIIASVAGQGGVTMPYWCPNCNSFCLEDYIWLWREIRLEATQQALGGANL